MRVAIILNQLKALGPVYVVRNLLSALSREGRYSFYLVSLRGEEPMVTEWLRAGYIKDAIALNKSFLALEMQPKKVAMELAERLSTWGVELVHSHSYQADIVSSFLPKEFKRISTQHNIAREDYPLSKGYWLGGWMAQRLYRRLKHFDSLVAITQSVSRSLLRRRLPAESIEVIYNAVDARYLEPLRPSEKGRLREEYQLREGAFVVVQLGALIPLKQPELSLKSFQIAKEEGYLPRDARLYFIGSGALEDRLKDLAGRDESIHLLGQQRDPRDYLLLADAMLMPSRSEGFGLALIEGLASGLAVVASDIPAFRELASLLEEAPISLVAENSPQSYALALGHCYKEHQEVQRATTTWLEDLRRRFSPEAMGQRYAQLYRRLLEVEESREERAAVDPIALINRFYQDESPELREILLRHSESVAKRALEIVDRHPELGADRHFVYEAAMLHDIGIKETQAPGIYCQGEHSYIAHGYLGAEILRREGFQRHALVAERHTGTGLSWEALQLALQGELEIPRGIYAPQSVEEEIICYADKFYSKSRLEEEKTPERIRKSLAKYGKEAVDAFDNYHRRFS